MSKEFDPPHIYFSGENAKKFSNPKAYISAQMNLFEKAWEYLDLENNEFMPLVLDVGCGAGCGADALIEKGLSYVGLDISPDMLMRGLKRQTIPYNSFVCADAGAGIPFRPGVFDAVIGIEVLNWILRPFPGQEPVSKRLKKFFESVHGCLCMGGKAIFQFNPVNPDQAQLVATTATLCGFAGRLQTDNPNSPIARITWLILEVGGSQAVVNEEKPQAGVREIPAFSQGSTRKKSGGFNKKEWIIKKKERQRLLGKKVANDSKYTGRSRRRWI